MSFARYALIIQQLHMSYRMSLYPSWPGTKISNKSHPVALRINDMNIQNNMVVKIPFVFKIREKFHYVLRRDLMLSFSVRYYLAENSAIEMSHITSGM